ncbi:hypothetical protein Tco_0497153 [Tanacetum coccineum]
MALGCFPVHAVMVLVWLFAVGGIMIDPYSTRMDALKKVTERRGNSESRVATIGNGGHDLEVGHRYRRGVDRGVRLSNASGTGDAEGVDEGRWPVVHHILIGAGSHRKGIEYISAVSLGQLEGLLMTGHWGTLEVEGGTLVCRVVEPSASEESQGRLWMGMADVCGRVGRIGLGLSNMTKFWDRIYGSLWGGAAVSFTGVLWQGGGYLAAFVSRRAGGEDERERYWIQQLQ